MESLPPRVPPWALPRLWRFASLTLSLTRNHFHSLQALESTMMTYPRISPVGSIFPEPRLIFHSHPFRHRSVTRHAWIQKAGAIVEAGSARQVENTRRHIVIVRQFTKTYWRPCPLRSWIISQKGFPKENEKSFAYISLHVANAAAPAMIGSLVRNDIPALTTCLITTALSFQSPNTSMLQCVIASMLQCSMVSMIRPCPPSFKAYLALKKRIAD